MLIEIGDILMAIRKVSLHFFIVIIPLSITGILHMLVVKYNLLSLLKTPINEKAFGANKTWRGVIFVTFWNAVFLHLWCQIGNVPPTESVYEAYVPNRLLQGALFGLTYMLFELPNSYFKRRIGIKPGESSKEHKTLIHLLDKTDSAFGVALVYYLFDYGDLVTSLMIFVIGSAIHMFISQVLYSLKIKKGY